MKCSYCQREIIRNLTFTEILTMQYRPVELCASCRSRFRPIPTSSCPTCRKPLISSTCFDCQKWHQLYPDYDFQHHALYCYEDGMKEWLQRYKFNRETLLATTFSLELVHALRPFKNWLICAIPISTERLSERGFNQVSFVLDQCHIKHYPLLKKELHLLPQSKQTRHERLEIPQPFRCPIAADELKGRSILLVDDVYTTGRTLFHAAMCLRTMPIKEVHTFSFAR